MAFWSGFLSTPSFIFLYRIFDRMLPASSPATIAARVGITFLMSIPVNTVFFCYGTFVHHFTEWAGLINAWRYEVPDASIRQVMRQVPFDWPMLRSSARLKIETELGPTVIASAGVWIPINAFNFTFVPPHLRPLTLTTFSAFWNCYLSLAQHREAKINAP